ncbi:ParM/StbA family protein [Bacillus mycoides]|uniref:ParM/StbA family protein n=1 Tax=Bacillus mycoides TaxID=1405 RepID=UPI003D0540EB
MKTETMHYVVQNDNGNSEQKITINGELKKQANVYKKLTKKPTYLNLKPENVIPNLLENLNVSITSGAVSSPGMYFIGDKALKSSDSPNNLDIDVLKKYEQELPVINTSSFLAGYAVQEVFKKSGSLPNRIDLTVEMETCLPASEWTIENAEQFEKKYIDHIHTITVHVDAIDVVVNVNFEKVDVLQEGVSALFALINEIDEKGIVGYRSSNMFTEFQKTYQLEEITGEYFESKRIQHADIGDGTTEFPLTEGYDFEHDKKSGKKYGIGHAIESAKEKLADEVNVEIERQHFAEIIKDPNPNRRFKKLALAYLDEEKVEQADNIYSELTKRLRKAQYNVDVVAVYGGGNIHMKDVLYDQLKEFCDKYGIKVLWIPKDFTTNMNVEGMTIYHVLSQEDEE